jgi:hypothetical protein
MTGSGVRRRDYATGLAALFILGIALLPVGGVIILGLLAPFWIAGLLVMAIASLFRPRR